MTNATGDCCNGNGLTNVCVKMSFSREGAKMSGPHLDLLTCRRAQRVADEAGRRVKEGTQVKGGHVKGFHSIIHDPGVSVEAGPRVNAELPIGSVEHMGHAVSLKCALVFGCVPARKRKLRHSPVEAFTALPFLFDLPRRTTHMSPI